jgi:hypothetical protein
MNNNQSSCQPRLDFIPVGVRHRSDIFIPFINFIFCDNEDIGNDRVINDNGGFYQPGYESIGKDDYKDDGQKHE